MDKEEPHKHFLVAILTVIQAILTLGMKCILTVLVQWDKALDDLVAPQDMIRERLPLDTAQEQGGVISQTSHGHLPRVTLIWQEPFVHLFLH